MEPEKPTTAQRWEAVAALGGAVVLLLLVVGLLLKNPVWLLVGVLGLGLIGGGGWWALTEQPPKRGLGIGGLLVGLVAVVAALLGVVVGSQWRVLAIAGVLLLTAAIAGEARLALTRDSRRVSPGIAPRPQKPVLIANPKSGGGKVDKFDLVRLAREQGVEVVLLNPGDDLEQLARDAIARGADCLGMAGGDGSQALVASVASAHDLPFVCISAGTRNHFALDLGLNREDPREGLIAFTEGIERRIDYATVGDRLFVNNVSMGVYATIVQEEGYRDAKVETSKELLPELLGRQQEPFDLRFTAGDGTEVDGAFLILVSNNPYVLGPKLDVSQRRSLSTGRLGVFAINARSGAEAAAAVARSTLGLGERDPHIFSFEAEEFEVRSHSGHAYAGVDGEALDLPTPLRFRIHAGGLRVRVPADSLARLDRRRARTVTFKDLLRVAGGHPLKVRD